MGNNIENGNPFFKGKIDGISLWSDSLSIQEIKLHELPTKRKRSRPSRVIGI